MKITKEKAELKSMDLQELAVRVEGLRRELFGIKLSAAASHVKDYSRYKKLRAQIARVLTYVQIKKSSQAFKN